MVRLAVQVAFNKLGVHRLEASIDRDNKRSIHLAVSCGLLCEGIKKNYLLEGGRWVDQMVFVATPEMKLT